MRTAPLSPPRLLPGGRSLRGGRLLPGGFGGIPPHAATRDSPSFWYALILGMCHNSRIIGGYPPNPPRTMWVKLTPRPTAGTRPQAAPCIVNDPPHSGALVSRRPHRHCQRSPRVFHEQIVRESDHWVQRPWPHARWSHRSSVSTSIRGQVPGVD